MISGMIDRESHSPSDIVADPVHVRRALAREVQRVLAGTNGNGRAGRRIVRVVLPVEPVAPLAWLRTQDDASVQFYWTGRDDDEETAALGVADQCVAPTPSNFDSLRRHLGPVLATCDAGVRYYGGMRFDPVQEPEGPWQSFGAYRFVLPRFERRRRGNDASLICNLVLPNDYTQRDAILADISTLPLDAAPASGAVSTPIARTDVPDAGGWRRHVEWALSAFHQTTLGKVVLARRAIFDFDEDLDALALLDVLQAGTPACFHFYMKPTPGIAFLGATPERLFLRRGSRIDSEAVAGTRPRGASATDDARLLEELLHSDKDRREHEYVRQSIREELADLSDDFRLDAPSEMKLASGRHLVSRIQATLRAGVTSLDVLDALHPTPAVGGYPTAAALEAIRAHESFDRGWYAGPVGWIGPDAAEFAVGIRSGLVEPRRLSLFSGAGIVAGSEPASEWDEIEYKLGDFIKILLEPEYR